MIANPVGNCPDSTATGRELTELAARHPGKEIGLAVAGRQGEDQQLGGDLPKGLFDGIIAEGRVRSSLDRCIKLKRKRSFGGNDPASGGYRKRLSRVRGMASALLSVAPVRLGGQVPRAVAQPSARGTSVRAIRRQRWPGRRSARVSSSSGVLHHARIHSHGSSSIGLLTWCTCYTGFGDGTRVRPCCSLQ